MEDNQSTQPAPTQANAGILPGRERILQPTASIVAEQEKLAAEAATNPTPAPVPAPAAPAVQAKPAPAASPAQPQWQSKTEARTELRFQNASAKLDESLTLGLGILAGLSFLIVGYFIKNDWVAYGTAIVFGVAAIVAGYRYYSKTDAMTPSVVIGLSAATSSVLIAGNLIAVKLIIKSALNSAGF